MENQCQLIDGKALAQTIRQQVKVRVDALKERGVYPGLGVILVGDDPASRLYVKNKEKACQEAGIRSHVLHLPETITQEELEDNIRLLNEDNQVHGILVQLPLPDGLDATAALQMIHPSKDVDGFTWENAGMLMTGERGGFAPCTSKGCMKLLQSTGLELAGKEAVIVGRSNIVGKPLAILLLQTNCTVTIAHSHSADLASITRRADILVAAAGRPGLIQGDMVKPGAAVIDVGINRVDGKLCGDVAFDSVSRTAGYLTPVPGGVGPMTIAMLLENTVLAAERRGYGH